MMRHGIVGRVSSTSTGELHLHLRPSTLVVAAVVQAVAVMVERAAEHLEGKEMRHQEVAV